MKPPLGGSILVSACRPLPSLGVGALSVSSPSHYRRSIMGRRKACADESGRPLTENGNYRYRPIAEVDDRPLFGSQIDKWASGLGAAAYLWRDLDDQRDTLVGGNIDEHTFHPDIARSRHALERPAAQITIRGVSRATNSTATADVFRETSRRKEIYACLTVRPPGG